jgi:hypothetical protein
MSESDVLLQEKPWMECWSSILGVLDNIRVADVGVLVATGLNGAERRTLVEQMLVIKGAVEQAETERANMAKDLAEARQALSVAEKSLEANEASKAMKAAEALTVVDCLVKHGQALTRHIRHCYCHTLPQGSGKCLRCVEDDEIRAACEAFGCEEGGQS